MSFEKSLNINQAKSEENQNPKTESVLSQDKLSKSETAPKNIDQSTENERLEKNVKGAESYLNPDNKGFFQKMSEKGQAMASNLYENLYKTPGINKIVGKVEIAYNNYWSDKHQEKYSATKSELNQLDNNDKQLGNRFNDLEKIIQDSKLSPLPGIDESLQFELDRLNQEKFKLSLSKEKLNQELELQGGKVNAYTEKRDQVVDKLVGYYQEKLQPMEQALNTLRDKKDSLDLLSAVAEAKHKEQLSKVNEYETRKNDIISFLEARGDSVEYINKSPLVKTLNAEIFKIKSLVQSERSSFAQGNAEINKEIEVIMKKSKPYSDKVENFQLAKNSKPLLSENKIINKKSDKEKPEDRPVTSKTLPSKTESSREKPQTTSARELISAWNLYLKSNADNKTAANAIDLDSFTKTTRLSGDSLLELSDFKNILIKYYKLRKDPIENLKSSTDDFGDNFLTKSL
jgi:hypothetical protein